MGPYGKEVRLQQAEIMQYTREDLIEHLETAKILANNLIELAAEQEEERGKTLGAKAEYEEVNKLCSKALFRMKNNIL